MKIVDIANSHKVSLSMVYHLLQGIKKTTNLGLAISVSKITGGKPIDYVSIKYRKLALAAHPELTIKAGGRHAKR